MSDQHETSQEIQPAHPETNNHSAAQGTTPSLSGSHDDTGEIRLGVYLCECGTNIGAMVDVAAVRDAVKNLPDVVVSRKSTYTCATAGQEDIKKDIVKNRLTGVVIASCSPKMHGRTFATTVSAAGLNPHKLHVVNIREHCSWVHKDKRSATAKAINLVRGGIARARELEALESGTMTVSKEALVVGGGIAGITSALQLADSGFKVVLAEKSSSIGGNMAKLSKTFPTLDCSPCILSPRMVDVALHPNIEPLTDTELIALDGSVGSFAATLYRQPRGVDAKTCISCGLCSRKCPVSVPAEFEDGLYERTAIYRMFEQAVPSHYAIDFGNCIRCGSCVEVCPRNSIDLDEEGIEITRTFGAVVTATGFSLMDVESRYPELLSEHPSVITAMELERFMINEGAAGEVLKRKDRKRIKNVAFLLCIGSRDPHRGAEYCSKICCTYATKLATLLKKTYKYMRISVHYIDVRTGTKGCEEFYCTAQDYGIDYIRGKIAEIAPENARDMSKGGVILRYEDTLSGAFMEQKVDLAVLCTAMIPDTGLNDLAGRMGVPLGPDGFIAEKHPKLDPVATHKKGVLAAGCVLGPRDIHDSVTDGKSAAAQVMQLLGRGEIEISPVRSRIARPDDCTSCGRCAEICPQNAISMTSENENDTTKRMIPEVNQMLCIGCGACAGVCPEAVIDIPDSTEAQLDAEIEGVLLPPEDSAEPVVVGFFGDTLSYVAADSAGTARLNYSTGLRIIDVPTTMRIAPRHIIRALVNGADGVLLSDEKGGHEEDITGKTIERTRTILQEAGIDPKRVEYMPMLLPTFKTIPKIVNDFVASTGRMEPISDKQRAALREHL